MRPRLFPVFLDLAGKPVLVVGAGAVAAQKLAQLVATGARLTVLARDIGPDVRNLVAAAGTGQFSLVQAALTPADLGLLENLLDSGFDLVITATDDPALNAAVVAAARRRNIWANAVDEPAHCDFYTASVVERGPLRLAISSEGRYPGLCVALREYLEEVLPDAHLEDLEHLADLRAALKTRLPDPAERGRALKAIARDVATRYFQ